MRRDERGSILAHVLITSVLISIVAAGLASVIMLQYRASARADQSQQAKKLDEEVLSAMIASWNTGHAGGMNEVCTNFTVGMSGAAITYACTGTSGTCSCTCVPGGSTTWPKVTVTAGPFGYAQSCSIAIASADATFQ